MKKINSCISIEDKTDRSDIYSDSYNELQDFHSRG